MARRMAGGLLVLALVAFTGTAALAQGYGGDYDMNNAPSPGLGKAQDQLRTAIEHARNAVAAGALGAATMHLGHALNCIEGTRGRNFNASWGHVCQGMGDGITTDIRAERNGADVLLVLQAADGLALDGVHARELGVVQQAARGVAALLQVVLEGIR